MYEYCRLVGLFILLSTTIGLAQERSLSIVVVENAPRVMLRSAPRVRRQTAIDSVARGTRLPLVDQMESWFQVRLADGTTAWISRAYARTATLTDPHWIIDADAPLRSAPSDGASIVGPVAQGELVPVTGREGDWAQIQLPNGDSGWISVSALETALPGVGSETAPESESARPSESPTTPEAMASTNDQQSKDHQPGEVPSDDEPGGQTTDQQARPSAGASEEPSPATSPVPPTPGGAEKPAAEGEGPAVAAEIPAEPASSEPPSFHVAQLAGLLGGVAVLLAVGYWWFRRRRVREIEQLIRAAQGSGGAIAGGEFLKSLRESEARQAKLEKDLQQRLAALRQTIGGGESGQDSDERFAVSRIEEVRKLVLEQQAKVNALSDLLALQNQKLAAAEEENRLLRRLLPRH